MAQPPEHVLPIPTAVPMYAQPTPYYQPPGAYYAPQPVYPGHQFQPGQPAAPAPVPPPPLPPAPPLPTHDTGADGGSVLSVPTAAESLSSGNASGQRAHFGSATSGFESAAGSYGGHAPGHGASAASAPGPSLASVLGPHSVFAPPGAAPVPPPPTSAPAPAAPHQYVDSTTGVTYQYVPPGSTPASASGVGAPAPPAPPAPLATSAAASLSGSANPSQHTAPPPPAVPMMYPAPPPSGGHFVDANGQPIPMAPPAFAAPPPAAPAGPGYYYWHPGAAPAPVAPAHMGYPAPPPPPPAPVAGYPGYGAPMQPTAAAGAPKNGSPVPPTDPAAAAAAVIAAGGGGDEECNILVAGLTRSVDDSDLRRLFDSYGEIVSASIIRKLGTGVSRGFGFVLFKHERDALKAIAKMHNSRFGPNVLNVHKSQHDGKVSESNSLFIRNLPPDVPGDRVSAFFDPCGPVKSVQVSCDPDGTTLETFVRHQLHTMRDKGTLAETVTIIPFENSESGASHDPTDATKSSSEAQQVFRAARSLSSAFVMFETVDEAKTAVSTLHNRPFPAIQVEVILPTLGIEISDVVPDPAERARLQEAGKIVPAGMHPPAGADPSAETVAKVHVPVALPLLVKFAETADQRRRRRAEVSARRDHQKHQQVSTVVGMPQQGRGPQ